MSPFFLRWRASHCLHRPTLASYSIEESSWYLNFSCLAKENNIALDIRASWHKIHQKKIIIYWFQSKITSASITTALWFHIHQSTEKRMRPSSFLPHCSCLDQKLHGTCFSREVGLDNLQRFLPTPAVLWYCDSSPWIFSLCSFLFSPIPQLE